MYTVYKTVNLVNGKYYIGVHKTDNPDDSYLGSGKLLKRAISKYGVNNFKKEIIAIFDNKEQAYSLENELVVISEQSYNLKLGGEGGFDLINSSGLTSSKTKVTLTAEQRSNGGKALMRLYRSDESFKKKRDEISTKNLMNSGASFLGRKHSVESKTKIGEKNKVAQLGEKNSQFGTCWITNTVVNKKIKLSDLDEYISSGWMRGRV